MCMCTFSGYSYIMCSFHLESSMWLVKRWTCDFEIEISSFNEVENHSTTPTSKKYFQTTWKLITTHNHNSWKCGILKQIIIISTVFNHVKM